MTHAQSIPQFTAVQAAELAQTHYGLQLPCKSLASYIDQNLCLGDPKTKAYVLKIANAESPLAELEMQSSVLEHLAQCAPELPLPRLIPTLKGESGVWITGPNGMRHYLRLLTYLPGRFLADVAKGPQLFHQLGRFFAQLDQALAPFQHHAAQRRLDWDLAQASAIRPLLALISDHGDRALATWFCDRFDSETAPRLPNLPRQIIHNDGNDYNILADEQRPCGLIDFGDMVHSYRICELAIVATYAMIHEDEPLKALAQVAGGYHACTPLLGDELDLLFPLVCMRLVTSVAKSAAARALQPKNDYASISEVGAWRLLRRLIGLQGDSVTDELRQALGFPTLHPSRPKPEVAALRKSHLNPTLSVSYEEPLQIVRGFRQYLYDEQGRAYLDGVNNVCHVGHCHPHVVSAGARQMAMLNTNTRYLSDLLVRYAERLLATFPPELEVVTFVCSGSEANDLALRMARTHTGRRPIVVLEHAYHGNTTANIEISPYKYRRKGGPGKQEHICEAQIPDGYRGPYKGHDEPTAKRYAEHVGQALAAAKAQGGAAAFIAESVLGCGGQVVLPPGYLRAAYAHAREAGAVCIADEVQVGFGRVGSHFWAFQTQGVIPDIVTLGKPIGNGHPLAAVVTTRAIAESFKTGMEYFNTFGGNPVSCAIGMAVLDVIESESLQANAQTLGAYLLAELKNLAQRNRLIGEVRGLGLFIGIELVRDPLTLEPATQEAKAVIQALKQRGILLSTDGPYDNVLKLKPPLVFTLENAKTLIANLDEVMSEVS